MFAQQKELLKINHADMKRAKEESEEKINMANDENGTVDLIKDLFKTDS